MQDFKMQMKELSIAEAPPVSTRYLSSETDSFFQDMRLVLEGLAQSEEVTRDPRSSEGMEPDGYDVPKGAATAEDRVAQSIALLERHSDEWTWLYQAMHDDLSRQTLLTVLAYRILGWPYVPLPLDCADFWLTRETLENVEAETPEKFTEPGGGQLSLFDLNPFGFNVKIFTKAFGVINEFSHSQYVYRGADQVIAPAKGDTVLDCGACFGGTSLFFLHAVGATGRVFSFEFSPSNLAIFRRNLALNPDLSQRSDVVQAPVGEISGQAFSVRGSGPATHLVVDSRSATRRLKHKLLSFVLPRYREYRNEAKVETLSIDDLAGSKPIERIDYIKMDIEGAELAALKGAKRILERDRPTLAICVYHKLEDFHTIPSYIDGLGLGYEFYLQHGTLHNDETVLFAKARLN
ncbi:FkbM family methyltransferase [Tateyamaria sp. Alg231-49]|uniref:FkbM family methyltransferase n=1 Tax=Tateyamaria sp. Alg231-49 TaxID=1922219 RepID=UPI000D54C3AF|nr:FkbM family methyltransferase [Tateyamaria sp. Alg231-49]